LQGMRAAAERVWGPAGLRDRLVGVAGVGKVGRHLVEHLVDEGARVVVTDVVAERVETVTASHPQVEAVASTEELVRLPLDVYAPCALGGALDDETVEGLRAAVVCGAANNQLAHPGVEKLLDDRNILYAPDYVVNAGGLVQVADEIGGFSFDRAKKRVEGIRATVTRIFAVAAEEGVPPAVAADRMAERRMSAVRRLRDIHLP